MTDCWVVMAIDYDGIFPVRTWPTPTDAQKDANRLNWLDMDGVWYEVRKSANCDDVMSCTFEEWCVEEGYDSAIGQD